MIRSITGVGEGHGAYIAIHDGFLGVGSWAGFLEGSDRMILDTHPYFAFNGGSNTDPIATGTGLEAGGIWPQNACNAWADSMNTRYLRLNWSASHCLTSSFTVRLLLESPSQVNSVTDTMNVGSS